jgi:hypothetical protein
MSDGIIKKYGDFMSGGKYTKSLNRLFIEGVTKGTFFQRPKEFELIVYFTPIKRRIVDISFKGISVGDSRLNINFKIGDNIDIVKDWVNTNGYKITHEIDRL